MGKLKRISVVVLALAVVVTGIALALRDDGELVTPAIDYTPADRHHLDHSAYFSKPFASGSEVTKACLECHPEAGKEMLKSAHFTWLGDEIKRPGMDKPMKIGKRNLINNFCISITGNWPSCTKCHAGYGWRDDSFDFNDEANIDCLVCHSWDGAYAKNKAGVPKDDVDLQAVAQSVGYPKRENCGVCHYYGGGGLGVKHGDLDNSLDNPTPDLDIHMGKHGFMCIDCHKTEHHRIPGKSIAVSVSDKGGISCQNCHVGRQHEDERLEMHAQSVACQTCHIPEFARKVPTKMEWDWSKAGDDSRVDDVHHYLKIKGEFKYELGVVPDYGWFNGASERYLAGDPINPDGPTNLNDPKGDIHDPNARIWPFKIHRGKQPYDKVYHYLLQPVTATEGGYWFDFDWDQAFRLAEKISGQAYSGEYGFAETEMFWPLSHMVAPKDKALGCTDCHGEGGRMNWEALGYEGDPIEVGGRR